MVGWTITQKSGNHFQLIFRQTVSDEELKLMILLVSELVLTSFLSSLQQCHLSEFTLLFNFIKCRLSDFYVKDECRKCDP